MEGPWHLTRALVSPGNRQAACVSFRGRPGPMAMGPPGPGGAMAIGLKTAR